MKTLIALLLLTTVALAQDRTDPKLAVCHQQLSLAQVQLENVVAQYEAQIAELKKQLEAKPEPKK